MGGSVVMDDGAAVGETGDSAEEALGRRAGAIESRVGYDVSSAVVGCAREGETEYLSDERWELQKSSFETYMAALQQRRRCCYSNTILLWQYPIGQHYSSSFVTFHGVALWIGGDESGGFAGEELA